MKDLMAVQQEEWDSLRREVRDLQRQVRQVSLQPLAILAVGTQEYPTPGNLPAGQRGMLATVINDGGACRLFWHDGAVWRRVTTT